MALAIVAVMLIPHLAWVAQNWSILSAEVEGQIIGPEAPPYARRVLDGLGRLAEASVSILIAPLGIMAAVFFPGAFRRLAIADRERVSGLALLRRLLLFCLGLMLLYVLAGASYVKPHHLFFLAFAPLWLIARLDAARLPIWRPRGFAIGLAACAAVAALAFPFDNLADATPLRSLRGIPADGGLRHRTPRRRLRARHHPRRCPAARTSQPPRCARSSLRRE